MFSQFIVVEFGTSESFVLEVVSKKQITVEKVAKYLKETEGFDELVDSFTFIDEPTKITL